jgi:hypothetical protein
MYLEAKLRQLHRDAHSAAFIIQPTVLRNSIPGKPDQMGFYLYVYENGRDICDYLQDTLDNAKHLAFKKCHVPYDAWKQKNET